MVTHGRAELGPSCGGAAGSVPAGRQRRPYRPDLAAGPPGSRLFAAVRSQPKPAAVTRRLLEGRPGRRDQPTGGRGPRAGMMLVRMGLDGFQPDREKLEVGRQQLAGAFRADHRSRWPATIPRAAARVAGQHPPAGQQAVRHRPTTSSPCPARPEPRPPSPLPGHSKQHPAATSRTHRRDREPAHRPRPGRRLPSCGAQTRTAR